MPIPSDWIAQLKKFRFQLPDFLAKVHQPLDILPPVLNDIPQEKSPFLADVRALLRPYSRRTEQAYVAWVKRFILFHGKQHPKKLAEKEVQSFLTDLAVSEEVAASTQDQALNALVFR